MANRKRNETLGQNPEEFGKLYLPIPPGFENVGSDEEKSAFKDWLNLFKEVFQSEADTALNAFNQAWQDKLEQLLALTDKCSKFVRPILKRIINFALVRLGIERKV